MIYIKKDVITHPDKWTTMERETIKLIQWILIISFLCFSFNRRIVLVTQWCFLLLLSSVCTELKNFQLLMACKLEGGIGTWIRERMHQDSWSKLAKWIFHTVWCHAQHINSGEGLLEATVPEQAGIAWRVECNFIVHHLFSIF